MQPFETAGTDHVCLGSNLQTIENLNSVSLVKDSQMSCGCQTIAKEKKYMEKYQIRFDSSTCQLFVSRLFTAR